MIAERCIRETKEITDYYLARKNKYMLIYLIWLSRRCVYGTFWGQWWCFFFWHPTPRAWRWCFFFWHPTPQTWRPCFFFLPPTPQTPFISTHLPLPPKKKDYSPLLALTSNTKLSTTLSLLHLLLLPLSTQFTSCLFTLPFTYTP